MRRGDKDNRTAAGDFPRTSRMHFAEEKVDEYGEGPQDQIIQPPDEGWDIRLFPHDARDRREGQSDPNWPGERREPEGRGHEAVARAVNKNNRRREALSLGPLGTDVKLELWGPQGG